MLALVHPSADVPLRNSQATTVAAAVTNQLPQRQQSVNSSTRRSASSAAASTSTSSSSSSSSPPVLHRHQTAPSSTSRIHSSSSSRKTCPHTPPRPSTPTPPSAPPEPPAPSSSTLPPVDIHSYPTTDLLKLLASLLAQIASTNDQLSICPNSITTTSSTAPIHPNEDTPLWHSLTTASRSAISTPASTLTFHARNIPTISLEAYFLRILKYCPTTNEVFLALLVYFDRMSKMSADATGRTFVIDSYNIHRLVIAGVTVASKFFSDVFYTNSRYAKVGGLPLPELNQLELQFLLLNDFRLVISSDEMQRYAEQLILFSRSSGVIGGDGHGRASTSTNTVHGAPCVRGSSAPPVAAPMSAMGAIDVYGAKVFDERTRRSISASSSSRHLPSHSYSHPNLPHHHHPPNTNQSHLHHHHRRRSSAATYDNNEDETETEIGTEDGSSAGTTDDEPTIRANSVINGGRRRESIDETLGDAPLTASRGEDALTHTIRCDDRDRTPERTRRAVAVRGERMATSP